MNTDSQTKIVKGKMQRRGNPPHFLQLFISGDFKSNDFASADSKRFAGAFFVSADSKGIASKDARESVTLHESVAETRHSVMR